MVLTLAAAVKADMLTECFVHAFVGAFPKREGWSVASCAEYSLGFSSKHSLVRSFVFIF